MERLIVVVSSGGGFSGSCNDRYGWWRWLVVAVVVDG